MGNSMQMLENIFLPIRVLLHISQISIYGGLKAHVKSL